LRCERDDERHDHSVHSEEEDEAEDDGDGQGRQRSSVHRQQYQGHRETEQDDDKHGDERRERHKSGLGTQQRVEDKVAQTELDRAVGILKVLIIVYVLGGRSVSPALWRKIEARSLTWVC